MSKMQSENYYTSFRYKVLMLTVEGKSKTQSKTSRFPVCVDLTPSNIVDGYQNFRGA